MKKINVDLGQRRYSIFVGMGVLSELPRVLGAISKDSPVVIITDRNVISACGKMVRKVLRDFPAPCVEIVLEPGEKAKSLKVFSGAVAAIAERTRGHKPTLVALGGGVIGDLAGFIAATYRRGVPLVQVPTTLLAQVDSSCGGKVGVDLVKAKNIVGAFYQPRAVLADTRFLKSLPDRQVLSGLAEVIKYAVIKSPALFDRLEKNMAKVKSLDKDLMEYVISRCLSIKAGIVERDEFDSGDVRIILNFGHTLGHAVESASGYSGIYDHGEAVSIGMVMAGEIAVRLGIFAQSGQQRMKDLLRSAGLPLCPEGVAVRKVLTSYKYDKKFTSGRNRFVLPEKIGKVRVFEDVPESLIEDVVSGVCGLRKKDSTGRSAP